MNKQELIKKLNELSGADTELGHIKADDLLLEFINDPEIKQAYDSLHKWYA